ncbi:MAG: hypothetical protein ACKO8T_10595, partial [Actinomycetota bacterium]
MAKCDSPNARVAITSAGFFAASEFAQPGNSPGTVAIGGGGGCLGVHLGLITYATQYVLAKDLKKPKGGRVGVPWAKSAPGIFCYNDLEAKPLDVLAGKTLSGA